VLLQWLRERRFRAAAWLTLASALTFGSWMTWTALAPRQLAGQSYLTDAVYAPAVPPAPRAAAPAGADSAPHPTAPEPAAMPSESGGQPPGLLATITHRLGRNVPTYLTRRIPAGLAMPTVPGTTLDNWFWVLVVAGCGTVGIWLLGQSMPGVAAYLLLYMGVLVVWPFLLSRFLVPVIPLLIGVLLAGGRWWGRRWSGTAGWAVAIGLSGILALSALHLNRAEWRAHRTCDRAAAYDSAGCYPAEQRTFFQAALAVERLTPEGSVLLTPKAATVFTLTGRTAVNELEAASLDAPNLQDFLRRFRVSFILLSHIHRDQWVIAGKLLPFCESLELVRAYGEDALLLRITNSGVTEPNACEAVRRFASVPW
jgi:hypothetical protein